MNALKNFLGLMYVLSYIWVTKYNFNLAFWIYIGIRSAYNLYSYFWDLYVDWGLLRSKERNKFGLRDKFLFPKWYYYFAAVSNFCLRFFWIIWIWKKFDIKAGDVNITKEL